MKTSTEPVTDLWNILEFYSEIPKSAGGLLNVDPTSKVGKTTISLFRAFVRQSKNYWTAAEALPLRSSALLFYYAFLNLAKALLLAKGRITINDRRIAHGIGYDTSRLQSHFNAEQISSQNGVFDRLYEYFCHSNLSYRTDFHIVQLLRYCSDITFQVEQAGFGYRREYPFLSAVVGDMNTNSA
jgi:hypothetical protein